MAFESPVGKPCRWPFTVFDKDGNATDKVDGTPSVVITGPATVLEVIKGAGVGEWLARFQADAPGTGSLSGTLDADLGEGVEELAFTLGDFTAPDSSKASSVKSGDASVE